MKKYLISLFLVLFSFISFSQTYPNADFIARYNKIVNLLKSKDYYPAINEMDIFIQKYPRDAGMYYNRGLSKFYLNDYSGAREDFLKSKGLGFLKFSNYFEGIMSKQYFVEKLTKDYVTDQKLTAKNGFKLNYTLKDSLQGALRPERTCFDVYFYDLTVKILPKTKSIEGSNKIFFKTTAKTNKIQIDLAENLQVNSILWKGKELKYTRSFNAIFIEFDEILSENENHNIIIKYSGKPRVAPSPPWNGGFVWKKNRFNHWVGVACEHLGASSWWPCKDHLTEKPDSMEINIQVPTGYQAVANGNLRSTNIIDKNYTNFEWFVSYPINSYGVTFYMGKFENFNDKFTNGNGSYLIDYYVLPQHLKKAKEFYSKTIDIFKVYEKLYGEYPYKKDGAAMVEAPYAGMEHQSAIAIGDDYGKTVRREYKLNDYDYLVVHETAHEWWGNTVTMGDMADAWISETFATYSEHLFLEQIYGYKEYVDASAKTMNRIFNIWPIVGIRDVNDNSFLGGDIYHKGAAMINNLRCDINNDSLFFDIVKGFYNQQKFKISKTSDFVNFVNEKTKKDYSDFFNKFLYDTEPPILQYKFSLKNDSLTFSYRWIKVGDNFTMPFNITINETDNYRLEGTAKSQVFKIDNVKSFYLPNEKRFDKEKILKNSFTYYWTNWIRN